MPPILTRQLSVPISLPRYNERRVLQVIRRMGEASKAELARQTKLTNTAVGTIVSALHRKQLLMISRKRLNGQRGQPATFTLGRIIKGWNEGLPLMKAGAAYIMVIPPELGYGEGGNGDKIPPNATLVFYVELIRVEE